MKKEEREDGREGRERQGWGEGNKRCHVSQFCLKTFYSEERGIQLHLSFRAQDQTVGTPHRAIKVLPFGWGHQLSNKHSQVWEFSLSRCLDRNAILILVMTGGSWLFWFLWWLGPPEPGRMPAEQATAVKTFRRLWMTHEKKCLTSNKTLNIKMKMHF